VALDCTHRGIGREDFSPTNLIPTEKGLGSFDSWPNSVWILHLSKIEVTSKPASEIYKEKTAQSAQAEKEAGKQGDSPDSSPTAGQN
jgi:hypothetical protein